MYLDDPVGASGAPNGLWTPPFTAEMAGKSPVVAVGLVQGTAVPPALASDVADVVHRGALVQLFLVPEPTVRGGAPAFASWVAQVVSVLEPVPLVEIGTGAAPPGSSSATVASYAAAGLAAAHGTAGRPTAGVVWLDGGTTSADSAVWSSLDAAGVWARSSFVATSLDATGVCTSPAAFAATLRRYPVAAGLPVVTEAVQATAPAPWVASDYRLSQGIGEPGSPSVGGDVEAVGRVGSSMTGALRIGQARADARPNSWKKEREPWMA
jgi:hypothetical protein